jgi:hypothetical protein
MASIIGILAAAVGAVFLGIILDQSIEELDGAEKEFRDDPELRDEDGDGEADVGVYKIPVSETDEPQETPEIGAETEIFLLRAGTYDIPDGTISISLDGTFSGSRTETNDYDGNAPPTEDRTEISGRISQNGRISGSFSGTDTYVNLPPSGYEYDIRDVQGAITGQIYNTGSFLLKWTGPEPGSQTGQLPSKNLGSILAAALAQPFSVNT